MSGGGQYLVPSTDRTPYGAQSQRPAPRGMGQEQWRMTTRGLALAGPGRGPARPYSGSVSGPVAFAQPPSGGVGQGPVPSRDQVSRQGPVSGYGQAHGPPGSARGPVPQAQGSFSAREFQTPPPDRSTHYRARAMGFPTLA